MRIIFIIFLQFLYLSIAAQIKETIISNNWYFSHPDTLFFSQTLIKEHNISQINEYRIDKVYADSAQIMSEYSFDSTGSIIKSKTYDIHNSPTVTQFKITSNGKMKEVWLADKNGVFTKTRNNFYAGSRLIKQVSHYGQDYAPSVEYTYSNNGLISVIQDFGPTGNIGVSTNLTYDSLNRLVSEVNKNSNDSIESSYFYKYDQYGRRNYTEYKEANLSRIETIDYSKSTSNCTVEKIHSIGKLKAIKTTTINSYGLTTELILDKRMNIKRRKKPNMFCGYSGPARYQKWTYEYDLNGNLICEKKYYSPHKISEQTNYTFDNKGNLIGKVIFKNSKKISEWRYSYKYQN